MSTEKNKRLAELLGWTFERRLKGTGWDPERWEWRRDSKWLGSLPDFCADINAVHEVIRGLDDYQKERFFIHITEETGTHKLQDRAASPWMVIDLLLATPEKITNALIETLEAKE